MSYKKTIIVQSRRDVDMGIIDDQLQNSGYLSNFNLRSINKIISDINDVINGLKEEIYWGQNEIMIITDKDFSTCTYENGEQSPDLPTSTILNLMSEIKIFKEHFQNPINLKNIIDQAFTIIKSNPNAHKRWTTSDTVFSIVIREVSISLVLSPTDLELSNNEYLNQLHTNF